MAQSREGAGDAVLGIIGVGGLAGFVVEGLRRAGDEREILLSPRGAAQAAHLAKRFGCRVAADNQAVVDGAALVIIATPPAAVLSCLSALSWRAGQAMICVAIDVTRATLAKAAPGALVLRAMPSNAAALGICPTPLFPPHAAAQGLAVLDRLQAFEAWQQAYGRAIARLRGETPA